MRSGNRVWQLTGRFLARNDKLYRPEIEVWRLYENGRMTIDLTFSEQVHDKWLRDAEPGVALAANLSLASRIRHELIEPCLFNLDESCGEQTIVRECSHLSRLVERIERDGYFIKWLTKDQLRKAFDREENRKLRSLEVEYRDVIRPLLPASERVPEITKLLEALELWEKNNLRFLDIGLRRYMKLLGLSDTPTPRVARNRT